MKVIVSHSGKQYAHRLINALIQDGHEAIFYTLFWYKPKNLFWRLLLAVLPKTIKTNLFNELQKKQDKNLENIQVTHNPFIELLRKTLLKVNSKKVDKIQLWADSFHDKWVAKRLKKQDYDIFIGYEMSSLESFKVAKSHNKITILDLAQIHYQEIEELAKKHSSLSHLKENTFRKKLNEIKEREYQLADKIITLSGFAYDSMIKHGISPEKLWVANLGYNEHIFQFKEKKQKQQHFNLVYTGAIIKRKGIIELKTALEEITKATDFKITLTLVGGLIDKDIFKNINFSVIHKPFMHHEELVKEYQNADLFVFPSLLDSWAMVVLESMGCGTPVIITENTGAKDAVEKYRGGKIIETGSVEVLKIALLDYFEHPEKILMDSVVAHEAARHFTWDKYEKNVARLIKLL